MSNFIAIGKTEISFAEIVTISPDVFKNEFERSAIKFCRDWITGQAEFKIRTSGSTGTPKEIILSREAMEASAIQTITALSLKKNDTALVCLDTKYIAGQMMLVRCLTRDMNIFLTEPSANPFKEIGDQHIDFVALVPFQLESILTDAPARLDRVRCAIIGGAKVNSILKEKIRKSRCAIYATYGMTETISHIALQKLNGNHPQEYFHAFDKIALRLDVRGCLCIKADYLGDEIITNDLVELLDSNRFKWLGRVDNVINSGGVKIIPEKIENVVESIFQMFNIKQRFFIAGVEDQKLGQRLVLIIEGKIFDDQLLQRINTEAAKLLPKFEVPREIRFIEKFDETDNGKIIRHSSSAKVST